jgi:hypothetical protein
MQEPPTEKGTGSDVARSVLVGTAQVLAVLGAIVVTIMLLGRPVGPLTARDRAYEAAMKSDLGYLEDAQDKYFADFESYGATLAELDFTASENINIQLTLAGDSAWTASTTHTRLALRCAIFVGNIEPPVPDAEVGVPSCHDPT